MKKLLLSLALMSVCWLGLSQQKLNYQQPPEQIMELVDAPLAPAVQIDSKGQY